MRGGRALLGAALALGCLLAAGCGSGSAPKATVAESRKLAFNCAADGGQSSPSYVLPAGTYLVDWSIQSTQGGAALDFLLKKDDDAILGGVAKTVQLEPDKASGTVQVNLAKGEYRVRISGGGPWKASVFQTISP